MAGGERAARLRRPSPGSTPRSISSSRTCARARAITVHGDYDVDGVCSTAILVRVLRVLGADVDWYLPSRTEDGYGLSAATVRAARRARHASAAHRRLRDHRGRRGRAGARARPGRRRHRPSQPARRRRRCPMRRSCIPAVCGYPCPDLCAAGVAYKLAAALLAGAGRDPAGADEDLDLVALATVADCVPLRDENRRLVREGLHALATSRQARASARCCAWPRSTPGALDARAIGFRLAPRINAAGRLYRADAGLELRAHRRSRARRGDRRRARPRQRRAPAHRDADPLRGRGAGARARRAAGLRARRRGLAPRGHRDRRLADRRAPSPPVRDARAGRRRGNRLGALDPGLRPARRARRERRAPAAPRRAPRRGGLHDRAGGGRCLPRRLRGARGGGAGPRGPRARPSASTPWWRATSSGSRWPRSSSSWRRSGSPTRRSSLLVPAARLVDARPMGEEGRHVRFTVEAGGHRARAVAFGTSRLPDGEVHDATFTLELNEWNGAVEPRLVLRHAQAPAPAAVALVGEPEDPVAGGAGRAGGAAAGGAARRRARPASRATGAGAGWPARWPRSWPPASRCWWRAPTRAAAAATCGPPRRLRRPRLARARTRPVAHRALRARRRARPAGVRRPARCDERFPGGPEPRAARPPGRAADAPSVPRPARCATPCARRATPCARLAARGAPAAPRLRGRRGGALAAVRSRRHAAARSAARRARACACSSAGARGRRGRRRGARQRPGVLPGPTRARPRPRPQRGEQPRRPRRPSSLRRPARPPSRSARAACAIASSTRPSTPGRS